MSADNWAICPRCLAAAKEDRAAKKQIADSAYGMVEVEEYERHRAASLEPIDPETMRTLREDYELGIDEDGEFSADYRAQCMTCELAYGYQFSEKAS